MDFHSAYKKSVTPPSKPPEANLSKHQLRLLASQNVSKVLL
jgi:hypothetical protein